MKAMERREFIKYAAGGMAALVVGNNMPWLFESEAYAAVQVHTLNFTITDALKGMATDEPGNISAECYFWIYKEANFPAETPGPHIFVTQGDTVQGTIKNDLDEAHSFFIPGVYNSGSIAPGATKSFRFIARTPGTYLYHDNLNAPVNRVMGLHGAFIVMPAKPALNHKFTPYAIPTVGVQKLFDDLGTKAWWPGLSWQDGDATTDTPAFRQYIWLLHQASPNLFAEVGSFTPGQNYPSAQFVQKFLHDTFSATNNSSTPQYFTISGQSGHFSHNNPFICPNNRVGEPVLIRILNAGLWTHSMHIHANHPYVIGINRIVQANPIWVDVFTVNAMDTIDWLVPYHRPPDVPNARGIGRADTPLTSNNGQPVWPPNEEINIFLPGIGGGGGGGAIDLSVQLSPLGYPMHDHSEPSQTSQGGNYNMGMISGLNFTGDRNIGGGVVTFPNAPAIHGPGPTGVFSPRAASV